MEFPLDIRTDLFVGNAWLDISSDVYLREVKNLVRGLRDMGSTADPSSLQLTLDNREGKYSPRNAMSPLFGLLGRNTPIRVSLPGEAGAYVQLDGRAGSTVSTPDTAALDITGDIDVRAEVAPDWYGPGSKLIIGKWDRATLQQSWALQIERGYLYIRYSTVGDASLGGKFLGYPLPLLPERAAVRVALDLNNGAGGTTASFYTADTLDGPWNLLGETTGMFSPTEAIYSGSAPLQIGITDLRDGVLAPRYPFNGRGYRFEVRNGINGPVVASPDFRAVAPGSTSLTDSAGRTWTLSGAAEVRDREDRFIGEVASWPLRWSVDDADRYAPITANGVLRRLGQGAKALESTLRRRVPTGNPIAYWPMEEQNDAVRAYSPVPGVLPASVSSVEWGGFDSLPSSAPLPRMTGESSLSATVPSAAPGQWHVELVYTADSKIPLDLTEFIKIYTLDGAIRRWELHVKNSNARVYGFNAANVKVLDKSIGVGADIFTGWVRLRFFARDDGAGGFRWGVAWQGVGGDAGQYVNTFAGTCGSVNLIAADWPAATEGWGFGHLAVLREAESSLFSGSDNAYLGESAWERMRRLGQEEGLSVTRTPGRLPVERIGFQRLDSLVGLLESAADGDGGLLTEDMRRIGLHYRDRSSMYAQEPAITLSYTAPGLGPDIEPVDDDSAIRNDVTVTRDGGSSARAVLTSGPLSVQPAPDGIGKYDAAYTVSLADDSQADYHAYWRLHLGTWDGARYPSVSLMLHKPGAEWLIPLVMRLREGDKIRLTDLPQFVSHDDVDLIVMGWTERLDMYRWELELNCVPAGPWDTATTGTDTVVERFESDRLSASITYAGAQPWGFSTAQARYGTRSLKAGAITHNQQSDAVLALPAGAASLSFWYRTSSEGSGPGFVGDYLTVLRDGVEVLRAQGETPWTQATVNVAGASTVTFRYRKDNSASAGSDSAWIDYLVIRRSGPTGSRATAGYSRIAAGVSASATSLLVRTNAGPLWTEEPADFPLSVRAAGEVMQVTGIGASGKDAFGRTAASGWGVADSGQSWKLTGGATADRSVTSGRGVVALPTSVTSVRAQTLPLAFADAEVRTRMSADQVSTGASLVGMVLFRWTSAADCYRARVHFGTGGAMFVSVTRGTTAVGGQPALPFTYTAGAEFEVRARVAGHTVSVKVWPVGQPEPAAWNYSATITDAPLATGEVGVGAGGFSGNTNASPTFRYDNFLITDSQLFTVVRSQNGVSKPQAAATPIDVAQRAITSL